MKKTRLISLLLTAALALSGMSMMVSAEEAEAEKVDLLDYAASTALTSVDDETVDGNHYLRVSRKNAYRTGINYSAGTQPAGVYYIEFDARTSADPVGRYGDAQLNDFRIAAGAANKEAGWSGWFWHPVEPAGYISGNLGGDHTVIKMDSEWRHYKLKFQITSSQTISLLIWGDKSYADLADFDIDNLRCYVETDDGENVIANYTFENGEVPEAFTTYSKNGDPVVAEVVKANDYSEAAPAVGTVNGTGDAFTDAVIYDFGEGIELAAGTIEFIGDARLSYYFKGYNVDTEVTVNAVIDGDSVEIATLDNAKSWWQELTTVPVELPEGGILTAITLTSTQTAENNNEHAASPVAFKDFSFVGAVADGVELPVEEEEEEDKGQMPNLGIVMVLLAKKRAGTDGTSTPNAAFTVDGKALSTKNVEAVEGNKYLEISERGGNTSGLMIGHNALPAGAYTLEFDLRSSVTLEEISGIDFTVNESYDIFRIRETFAGERTQWADFAKDGWTTISYEFNADGVKDYAIQIYGGMSPFENMPFDIDNVVIKDASGAVIFTENFDALDAQDFGSSLLIKSVTDAGNEISFAPRGSAHGAIVAEDAFISAKVEDNAVVSYNAEALAAGNYIAKGYIRNAYYNASASKKATADDAINSTDYVSIFDAETVFTYNGQEITAPAGAIGLNKNKFALKVSVGAETASYTVTSGWTAFEVPFTVAEGDAAPVVTFELDHDMPYTIGGKKVVPFDLKVEIVAAQ